MVCRITLDAMIEEIVWQIKRAFGVQRHAEKLDQSWPSVLELLR